MTINLGMKLVDLKELIRLFYKTNDTELQSYFFGKIDNLLRELKTKGYLRYFPVDLDELKDKSINEIKNILQISEPENIEEQIYDIVTKYDETGQVFECVEEIKEMLDNRKEYVLRYKTYVDDDLFCSCGMSSSYISVAYIDKNNELQIYGDRLTSR